jgi:hypothetical protein
MKKLTHIATALANNTLSMRDMTLVKGGTDNQNGDQNGNQNGNQNQSTTNITQMMDDEKRRERPGGGITTN